MELKLDNIKNFLVLGSGTLGLRVGLQAAISGFEVMIYDISQKSLDTAKSVQSKLCKSLVSYPGYASINCETVLARIAYTTDPAQAAENADFVSESVTEDPAIKTKVWEQFGSLCPEHTVFTTNTSFLLPSTFADASGRPDRFCAFHFHDVFNANVVDIMPHAGTAPWVTAMLLDLGKKLQQIPVYIEKETNGYLFNFMLMSILTSAGSLLARGAGSIQNIDRSFMGNFHVEVGPFGMLDQIGLDTAYHIANNNQTKQSLAFASILQPYVDAGKLGIKSGEGFYSYPNPDYQKDDFLMG